MEKFWWKFSKKFRWNSLTHLKKSCQKNLFFCKILWFTWWASVVSPEKNAQTAWNTFLCSRVIRVCTPCAPRVYTVCTEGTFSGEDGDLAVLDPGFLSKFVKNLSKFVKNCQKLSKILTKFVKICQNLSKFVKICQKLSKIVLFFNRIHLFILPDLPIKYTKNTGVYTPCTTGLHNRCHKVSY